MDLQAIRTALTIRLTEQTLLRLFSEGKLFGTVHTCIGQEFVGVSVARGLEPQDYVFSNHRCHGHFIARYDNVEGLVAEVMGKATGVCGGLGGSQHLNQDRFFSNGIQGGIVPVAAGLALAQKMDARNGIAVVFVGDGTLGEGTLYETMNIASKWELPLLVVLEDNLYAQSTHQRETLAGSIRGRFEAFGIDFVQSTTEHWEELLEQMAESVERVRKSGKPRCHCVATYRLMAHSKGDDIRSPEEIASYQEHDPLTQMERQCGEEPWFQEMLGGIRERLDRAVAAADAAPFGELDATERPTKDTAWSGREFSRQRVVDAVRGALGEALERHEKTLLIGEDIESPYGGAFKATAGHSQRYPTRVRNTPISEAAIVGIGNGLALGGYVPMVEIMFGDFLTLATDQWVNHAAKFRGMYHGQVRVPVIVRTPMGGKRGYGPTHSQSLSKLFLGLPDTQVLCLHHRYDPALLYRDLLASIDRPTLVLENKVLYGHYVDPAPPAGYELVFSEDVFPVARLRPQGPADVTMVALGGMSLEAEQAIQVLFEEEEVLADLFLPTQLYPFDISFLVESLSRTGRLIVVEEDQGFVSMSSEILAQVAEHALLKDVVCARVTARPMPIPSARPLEQACLPDAGAIVRKTLELLSAFG